MAKTKTKSITAQTTELAKSSTAKPRKGRGGTANYPSAKFVPETDEDRALVSKLLGEVMVEYKQPRVKSDKELAQRLNDYFVRCATNGQVPTVEEMSLCTGYSQQTCYDWETGRNHGFSPETSMIIKKAKEVLKTFDAKLVIAGKLNFLAYCFRAKNYYGMTDKQEVVLTPNQPLGDQASEKELEKKYIEDVIGVSADGVVED